MDNGTLQDTSFTCCILIDADNEQDWLEKFCFMSSQILLQYWRNVFQRYLNLHRIISGTAIYFRVALARYTFGNQKT
jgi:hypothetical protein